MRTASHLLAREGGAWLEVLVDEAAARTAHPFVLLPSSQRDAHDLQDLAKALRRLGHTVLRPQPRGMGRSSAPGADLSLHTLAADVACAIELLLRRPAVVAGHAFGHFIARVADLDHPHWVCGVAVIAGAARVFPPGLSQALDRAADAAQPTQVRLAALQHAFFAPGHDASSWLEGWHAQLAAAYRRAGSIPPKDQWWPVSHAPVLDLQAADDPWRPPGTRDELRDVLGEKVTVGVIAQASHAVVTEQPQAVARALSEWAQGAVPPPQPSPGGRGCKTLRA